MSPLTRRKRGRRGPGGSDSRTVRSKGVTGFPCRVVYFVNADLLTVVAGAHSKRRPGYWRDRVRS